MKIAALCPGPVDTEFNDVAGVKFSLKGITPPTARNARRADWTTAKLSSYRRKDTPAELRDPLRTPPPDRGGNGITAEA